MLLTATATCWIPVIRAMLPVLPLIAQSARPSAEPDTRRPCRLLADVFEIARIAERVAGANAHVHREDLAGDSAGCIR